MEAHTIKEGLEKIASKGARITTYIADTDSSTFRLL